MKGNKFTPFLIVSLTLTAFLAGYIMVSRGVDPGTPQTGTILDKFGSPQPVATQEQSPEEVKVFPVSSVKSISLSNSANRKGIYYFEKNTGKLFEFNFEDNKEHILSGTVLPNFLSSIWSPVKKEVLSLFYSPNGTKIKYHNYDTGKTVDLANGIHSVAFSPDGQSIAYYLDVSNPDITPESGELQSASEVGKIYTAQPDGTYPKKILDTRISDLEISWPTKDQISFRTPSQETFMLTREGGLTRFLDSNVNINTKWSIGGGKVLFSWGIESNDHQLWLKNVESKTEKDLNLSAMASKCAWSIDSTIIFCAVAKTPSIDDIYKINTDTGSQELIAETTMQVKNVFLTSLENYLILTNSSDEKLYGIKISD